LPFDGGLYNIIQEFSTNTSKLLHTLLVDIAETLLQHAQFSGTLPLEVDPQDNLTAIGLGIEEDVAESNGNLSKEVLELLEKRLGQRQVVSPEDAWFARIRVDIEQGRARRDDLKEANKLLEDRLKADHRATEIVQYFHPGFTKDYPIQRWSPSSQGQSYYLLNKSEKESYAKVLEEFLFLHNCKDHRQKIRCTYSRPRQYVMAAAVDLELSPEGLAACLKPLSCWNINRTDS